MSLSLLEEPMSTAGHQRTSRSSLSASRALRWSCCFGRASLKRFPPPSRPQSHLRLSTQHPTLASPVAARPTTPSLPLQSPRQAFQTPRQAIQSPRSLSPSQPTRRPLPPSRSPRLNRSPPWFHAPKQLLRAILNPACISILHPASLTTRLLLLVAYHGLPRAVQQTGRWLYRQVPLLVVQVLASSLVLTALIASPSSECLPPHQWELVERSCLATASWRWTASPSLERAPPK
mmetsp:Transcript_49177/g.122928  ORF Transcript_49177/g.122928 Transcript_49177/m.122928 type:complete len:233 (-) Transcript_49177:693-1391(-)